jgi:mannonate dehydratase
VVASTGRIRVGVGQLRALDAETAAWARQLGITTLQLNTPDIPGEDGYWHEADLRRLRDQAAAEGLTLEALENVPIAFYDKVMLGRPGWEDQLERYCRTIENVGRVGIGLLGHHFMPTFVWRTALDTPGRGGALVTSFDEALVPLGNRVDYPQAPPTEQVALEEMRTNYGRFLDATLPVAEATGVRLALHPDDPPVRAIGGVARLFRSPDDLAWALERSSGSPAWGVDLCLGTVSEMEGGPDAVDRAIDLLGPRGRICYVHFRQVTGTVPRFAECFIGEGNYSPPRVLRRLIDVGFDGFLLDDHVPHMTGDTVYGHRARAHAIGYLQGLLAALGEAA